MGASLIHAHEPGLYLPAQDHNTWNDPRAFHFNACSHHPQERKSMLTKYVPITALSGLLFSIQ